MTDVIASRPKPGEGRRGHRLTGRQALRRLPPIREMVLLPAGAETGGKEKIETRAQERENVDHILSGGAGV